MTSFDASVKSDSKRHPSLGCRSLFYKCNFIANSQLLWYNLVMQTDKKQRKTQTKEAVTQVLQSYAAPIALNELYEFIKVSLPKTAFSTIFRIVRQLEAEGKVVPVDWRERGSRYEWADLPHHHHIVCEDCGDVTDIDDQTLNFKAQKISDQTGYQVNHHSIELRGVCGDCQKKVLATP